MNRWVGRAIGLDVHRDFCVVAICEDGQVRTGARVPSTPEGLQVLAQSLLPSDRVALEVTGNAWEIARIIEPHVARVIVVSEYGIVPVSRPVHPNRVLRAAVERRAVRANSHHVPSIRAARPSFSIALRSFWQTTFITAAALTRHSRVGRAMAAIAGSEDAARALGVDVVEVARAAAIAQADRFIRKPFAPRGPQGERIGWAPGKEALRLIVGGSLLYRQFFELAVLGGTGLFDNARGSLVTTRMGVRPVRDLTGGRPSAYERRATTLGVPWAVGGEAAGRAGH